MEKATRERILIVDDSPDNLKLTQLLLECEGYQVRTAENAERALAVLDEYQPDLILMDIQLPGMDGLELTRQLRTMPVLENVGIVALTAYAMVGDEVNAREAGCDGYITKPIDTRVFPTLIRRYLDKAPVERRATAYFKAASLSPRVRRRMSRKRPRTRQERMAQTSGRYSGP